MGIKLPNMGMQKKTKAARPTTAIAAKAKPRTKSQPTPTPAPPPSLPPSLANALFSSTQQRVLGLLFGQPGSSFFATEIIARLGAGSGAVQRELKRLTDSGLVSVTRVGNQKHYQANPESPIYAELCALIRKTVGLAEPLRQALEPARDAIQLALIYGSVAKRRATASSDVDLLLVSDSLTLEDVYRLLRPAEEALRRTINPTLYTEEEFDRRLREDNAFLKRVIAGEVLLLIGTLPHE